jgi:outer membrane receptor protein involved in Fe transport
VVAGVFIFAVPLLASAQSGNALPRVEVIGSLPLPGLGQPLFEIAAPVQVARPRDIEQSGALDLSDFMNRALGSVHVNEMQGNPFQMDVNYRGYTASPLLGTPQGLSVYLDGVRMNQPFGDVVSWDLIPRGAIASLTLMPGSNPLFGLNTLGGALSVATKDGKNFPETSLQIGLGSNQRQSFEFEHGGFNGQGLNWYLNTNLFNESGWRQNSPSSVRQFFGKLGWADEQTRLSLTLAHADNQLTGNGLQEMALLARDYSSVYTQPDQTGNRSSLLNLTFSHSLNDALDFSGNAYLRRIKTTTVNGDINEAALSSADVYQPTAADQLALDAAGFSAYPASGANAANTPFPYWSCLAQVLQNDQPANVCTGLLNRTHSEQDNHGMSGQFTWLNQIAGRRNQFVLGAGFDASQVRFTQSTELGFVNPDRSVTGTGAMADGSNAGSVQDANGNTVPYDRRVDLQSSTRTVSVFAANMLAVTESLHVNLAGRYNDTQVQNRDQLRPAGEPASLSADHRFARFNPALGLTFSPNKNTNTYAGYSESSRAPTAVELGCANPSQPCKLPNAMAGDPPLNQVVTRTLELGVRGRSADLRWNAGLFRAENQDDILFVASSAGGYGYFKNFGQTRRQGLELGLNSQWSNWTLTAQYSWLDATYQSAETVAGNGNSSNDQAVAGNPGTEGSINIQPGDRIPLVPQHLLKLAAHWAASPAWAFNASWVAMGGVLARGNENAQHAPDGTFYQGPGATSGYAVLNVGAYWRPGKNLQFTAQINNLFDRRYNNGAQLGANAFDGHGAINADAFGNGAVAQSTFFAAGAPRSLAVALKYVFN